MKAIQKLTVIPLTALALAGLLTGCAHGTSHTADEQAQTVTATVATSSAAPTATASTPAAAAAPTAGATVAAAQVAAVRAAGGHVYVSPNGSGDGLVVDPSAPLPAAVITDTHAAFTDTQDPSTRAAFQAHYAPEHAAFQAIKDAGIKVFILWRQPASMTATTYSGTAYQVVGLGLGSPTGTALLPTKAAALAAAQPLFVANPGVPVVTFNDVLNAN